MKNTNEFINSRIRLLIIFSVLVLASAITIPILENIPSHPDEHQFYLNAFKILAGEELHNYLHIALTEYMLAGFLAIVNLFTASGVNFPQGEPTFATFFYGRVFGFLLYLLTFVLGVLITQKGERYIKTRSVAFTILYFGSLGVFERFLRVNSDSIMMFVFFNLIITSFWLHKQKASPLKFFLINLLFLFLGTFTNLKSLYLMAPIITINVVTPFIWYETKQNSDRLPTVYRIMLYIIGIIAGGVILWSVFMPKPFDYIRFWYGVKKTIVHGTQFDFDYPSQSFGSWKVYLYDLLIEYIGLTAAASIIILFAIAYKKNGSTLLVRLIKDTKNQIQLKWFREGNLYSATELIIFASFLSYYLGISSRVVHWSRWGIGLGLPSFILIGSLVEKILESLFARKDIIPLKRISLIVFLFIFSWIPRLLISVDLYNSGYPKNDGFTQTYRSVDKLLKEKNIGKDDALKRVTWFTGYTHNVNSMSLENLAEKNNVDTEYVLWPYWNIGLLYTKKNVDLETHNQREFVNKYGEGVEFKLPSFLSFYMHYTKYFAWKVLGITWNPEIDSLVETQYGVVKLKKPHDNIKLTYTVPFKSMSHYFFPYSLTFNMKTLTDGYMFPPCYSYPDTRSVKTGEWVLPPQEIGIGARTAGLYCHSVRFRVLFKGTYRIRVEGLPEQDKDVQKVFSNINAFNWDADTKTITVTTKNTLIPGDFGVATKEKNIKNLKFVIFYNSN